LKLNLKIKSIADVPNLTVDEGCDYFENIPSIKTKLLTLKKVGAGLYKNWFNRLLHYQGGKRKE
jgi:Excinuclease ATPase subunit